MHITLPTAVTAHQSKAPDQSELQQYQQHCAAISTLYALSAINSFGKTECNYIIFDITTTPELDNSSMDNHKAGIAATQQNHSVCAMQASRENRSTT
eukprot:12768-Heterococcus_DN1.PRE.1